MNTEKQNAVKAKLQAVTTAIRAVARDSEAACEKKDYERIEQLRPIIDTLFTMQVELSKEYDEMGFDWLAAIAESPYSYS